MSLQQVALICPRCQEPILEADVVIMKSPIIEVLNGEEHELIQHTPEKDKPHRERRRYCGEWLLR
jgi:hypothetical protein